MYTKTVKSKNLKCLKPKWHKNFEKNFFQLNLGVFFQRCFLSSQLQYHLSSQRYDKIRYGDSMRNVDAQNWRIVNLIISNHMISRFAVSFGMYVGFYMGLYSIALRLGLGPIYIFSYAVIMTPPISCINKFKKCWNLSQGYRVSPAMWHHAALPATRHRWTHAVLTPARQTGTRLTYLGGMEGWVDFDDWLYTEWFTRQQSAHLSR